MAEQNVLMLDTDHPNVVIKPVNDWQRGEMLSH